MSLERVGEILYGDVSTYSKKFKVITAFNQLKHSDAQFETEFIRWNDKKDNNWIIIVGYMFIDHCPA